jgi:hypothetical protein
MYNSSYWDTITQSIFFLEYTREVHIVILRRRKRETSVPVQKKKPHTNTPTKRGERVPQFAGIMKSVIYYIHLKYLIKYMLAFFFQILVIILLHPQFSEVLLQH